MNNPYIIGGVAVVIAILGWQLKSSVSRNGELTALLEHQAAETVECIEANVSERSVITELRAEIARMSTRAAADAIEREAMLVERDEEINAVRLRAAQLERERRNEIESNPECAELMSLSVRDICPDITFQLRQRAIGQSSN